MRIAELMHHHPVTIQHNTPVSTAASLLEKLDVRHLPVMDGTKLVGMLTDRDVAGVLYGEGSDSSTLVSKLMTPDAITIDEKASVREAVDAIAEHKIGALPVIKDDHVLVGIVSYIDVLSALADEESEAVVGEVMTESPVTIDVELGINDAISAMDDSRIRHLPVVDGGQLAGMLSDRNLAPLRERRGDSPDRQPTLASLMDGDVVSLNPESTVNEAIELMVENKLGALPVVSAESLEVVGILSYVDILRSHADLLD
jgi:predicted transcriptional regulator